MADIVARLEAWLSEEGKPTGYRFVSHMEYDSNWTGAFRVVLSEWDEKSDKRQEYIGEGGNRVGGLAEAISKALDAAMRVEASR